MFSLSADALLESGLTRGQEITQRDITNYKKVSADDKAFSLALAYVARRMRSEGEIIDYFRRKQYAPELSGQILDKLQKLNFVNDEEFASRWVENRRALKSTSTKKLRLELRQKKIADDIIRTVLANDETDERQLLRDIVVKKRKQSRYQDNQKLIAYLVRQGFTYDDIRSVMRTED